LKILISSYVFSPGVGGIEVVSNLLSLEFVTAGHQVILITENGTEDGISRPYQVVRKPGPRRLIQLIRWCDVYFQNNISLTLAWPLLLVRRPWVIAHHTWIGGTGAGWDWKGKLKRRLLPYATNATISHAMARDLPVPSIVLGNPFANDIFRSQPLNRDRDLVYVGRLVSDKGVNLLIQALGKLQNLDLRPRLTIIGSGPEEDSLRQLALKLGVLDQIDFIGSKSAEHIALLLSAHRVLVIPSLFPEPFGLVALEGIASGCVTVAADSGGLSEAIGQCGLLFPKGDIAALTQALHLALSDAELSKRLLKNASAHLKPFAPEIIAAKYLAIFQRSIACR